MAEITTTQSFSDGDTVTATKLNNIQGNASIQPEAITNRSAETSIDQANDLLLVYDASATALKKVTPSDLIKSGTASNFPITGNATIGGTLGVTGAITATSTINGTTIPTTKTLVTTVDTQTLTNKTLTSPSISDPTITGQITASTSTINVGSGQIYKDASGQVGIGTASPTNLLHIKKANALVNLDNADGNNSVWQQTSTDTRFGSQSSIPVAFYTNSIERLRIDSSGNVGIGIASPSAKLHVASTSCDVIIQDSDTARASNPAALLSFWGSDARAGYIGYPSDSNMYINQINSGAILFLTNSTERLRIDASGNVGVGTASPADTNNFGRSLDIRSSSGAASYFRDSDDASKYSVTGFFGADSNAYLGSWGASTGAVIYTSGTERLRIDSSGNVLIGTTSQITANAKFNVVGGHIAISDDSYLLFGNSATGIQGSTANNRMIFYTNNTERLRIASAGQIGIGGANYGTSGQVLTSAGASAAPSWTTISSTPADGSITFAKLSTSATEADNVAKRTAKAWVNFNGAFASTPFTISNGGIRTSFNVSSVTDFGTGDFGVNFAIALEDANYSVSAIASKDTPSSGSSNTISQNNARTSSTSQLCICSSASNNGGSPTDPTTITLSVFR